MSGWLRVNKVHGGDRALAQTARHTRAVLALLIGASTLACLLTGCYATSQCQEERLAGLTYDKMAETISSQDPEEQLRLCLYLSRRLRERSKGGGTQLLVRELCKRNLYDLVEELEVVFPPDERIGVWRAVSGFAQRDSDWQELMESFVELHERESFELALCTSYRPATWPRLILVAMNAEENPVLRSRALYALCQDAPDDVLELVKGLLKDRTPVKRANARYGKRSLETIGGNMRRYLDEREKRRGARSDR